MRDSENEVGSKSWLFSFPEAALLLVNTKNRDIWPGPSPTPEVRVSRASRNSAHAKSDKSDWFWSQSIQCVYKATQNRNLTGPFQRSWFLVLTKRSAASGDENRELKQTTTTRATRTASNKRFNKQNNSCARALYIFVHFFAVLYKTTKWNDQVLRRLRNVDGDG